jgi:hypothetical protein
MILISTILFLFRASDGGQSGLAQKTLNGLNIVTILAYRKS